MQFDIATNARTVVHLADYFGELKQAASQVAANISAVDRGYFTPDEDEQVQAILVSYLQSRSAFYDLINDCRHYHQLDEQGRNGMFLVGFAGALVLVDGARFLRELTESRPVVRRKLNQPVPSFDIPGGSYDTIQRSLIKTRHAWHLYHALKFFELHETELRGFARENHFDDLLRIIDELRSRANVSLERFALTRLRTRGDQTLRKLGRTLFQRSMYGIQKFFSSVVANRYVRIGHEPRLPEPIVKSLSAVATPGDVFVVRKEFAVTNYFLPGYWPHAALYLGTPAELSKLGVNERLHEQENGAGCWNKIESASPEDGRCVLESMKDGVLVRCWRSPLSSDSIVVLRPQLPATEIARAIGRALSHEGKRYDFDFDFSRADRLVCTEVVYRAYEGLGGFRFPLVRRAGRPTLGGADLVQMACDGVGFDPVAVFSEDKCGSELQSGDNTKQQVQSILGA